MGGCDAGRSAQGQGAGLKIDLISVDPLAAIQLVYAGKTQDLEFNSVWIVGQDEQRCALLKDYSAVGRFNLKFIADHHDAELTRDLKARNVELLLQVGSVIIRQSLLETPSIGVLNLHAGMLPRYRGLDSAMWAVLEGGNSRRHRTFACAIRRYRADCFDRKSADRAGRNRLSPAGEDAQQIQMAGIRTRRVRIEGWQPATVPAVPGSGTTIFRASSKVGRPRSGTAYEAWLTQTRPRTFGG